MLEALTILLLFAAAWALLANLSRLRELHAQHGVPESVTVATVSALGGVMGTRRHVFGRSCHENPPSSLISWR